MPGGISAVKNKFGLSFSKMERMGLNISDKPKTGRGLVYEMEVNRRGYQGTRAINARYYGLTRRSILERQKEHITDAVNLSPVGSRAGLNPNTLHFNNPKSYLAVLLSTAAGTVNSNPKNANRWLTTYRRAEPSILAIRYYESKLIDNQHIPSEVNPLNYETLLEHEVLNKTAGGDGFRFRDLSTLDRAVGAYYFVKEELNLKAVNSFCIERERRSISGRKDPNDEYYSREDYLVMILYSLYKDVDYLSNPGATKQKGAEEMMRLLELYFAFGKEIDKAVTGAFYTGARDRTILQSFITRKTSKEYNAAAVEEMNKEIAKINNIEFKAKTGALYSHLIGGKNYYSADQAAKLVKVNFQPYIDKITKEVLDLLRTLPKKRK